MSYLAAVRELARAKDLDPDKLQNDLVTAALASNSSVEFLAQSLLEVIRAYGEQPKMTIQPKGDPRWQTPRKQASSKANPTS